MSAPELIAFIIGAPTFGLVIQWLITRGTRKAELKKNDVDLNARWDQINNERFAGVQKDLRDARDAATKCQWRCDRYSELTLDLMEMLASHGIDTDEFRRRHRDIRSTAA